MTKDAATAPSVDVIVSTFNEERFVEDCLRHVLGQSYRGPVTVWLVDGGSTDATVERARRFAGDERLKILADGVRRNLPESLNVAIPLGSGDFVAKVDAHGYPALDFLERAVAAFEAGDGSVGCVGGRPEQVGLTPFGRALCAARGSRFGVGASEYAGTSELALVDTVQCGVYRRRALDDVGLFAADMNYGEDEELNWRLRRAGYTIVLDTRIRFIYYARSSWRAAFRQYRNYGRARVNVIGAHREFARAHHAVPAVAVASIAFLALGAGASQLARKTLGLVGAAYVASAVLASRTARSEEVSQARVVAAYTALHFGYGVGMLEGIGRSLARRLSGRRQT